MKYNRFLPLLIPFLVWLLLEVYSFWPKMVYVVSVLAVLLFFFAATQLVRAAPKRQEWHDVALLPSYFTIGVVVFSSMLPNPALVQLLFFFTLVFLYYYWRSIYYLLLKPELFQAASLENLSGYGNFLSFYFLASGIYGLQSFLNIASWILMLLLLAVIAAAVYQMVWVIGAEKRIGLFYLLIAGLILVELGWSISYLPLSFYILGLILAVYYYILAGLLRHYLLKKLDRRTVKIYLVFGFASMLAVLATARWL